MTQVAFYGQNLLGIEDKELPGRLIVLEGTDGVGRSTQIALLREWLESSGYAVASTGLKRSKLAGKGLKTAQEGHTLGVITSNVFYATDFADRMEKVIVPALRAGFIVLTDRYTYSMIARAAVRGVDGQWVRDIFSFALVPDAIFYMQVDLPSLIPRLLSTRGFDYWESGMDFLRNGDYYENYVEYQTRLLSQFDLMAEEFCFRRVDATKRVPDVYRVLRDGIEELLADIKPDRGKKGKK